MHDFETCWKATPTVGIKIKNKNWFSFVGFNYVHSISIKNRFIDSSTVKKLWKLKITRFTSPSSGKKLKNLFVPDCYETER